MNRDVKKIPHGPYCYDSLGVCPYWSIKKDKPYGANGYCSFLRKGDWQDNGTILLFDQVKECCENELTEDDMENIC
jgi:hypothetical protein